MVVAVISVIAIGVGAMAKKINDSRAISDVSGEVNYILTKGISNFLHNNSSILSASNGMEVAEKLGMIPGTVAKDHNGNWMTGLGGGSFYELSSGPIALSDNAFTLKITNVPTANGACVSILTSVKESRWTNIGSDGAGAFNKKRDDVTLGDIVSTCNASELKTITLEFIPFSTI